MTLFTPRLSRRTFLGASAVALLPKQTAARAATTATVVDIHCHVFNGSDLPITGFLAHYIPGLSDFSGELWGGPEKIVRKIVGLVHQKIINRVAPGKTAELAFLANLKPGDLVKPVSFLSNATEAGPYREVLKTVADELAAIPRLHLDGGSVTVTLDRVIQLIFLVSHERARIAATMATVYPEVDLFTPLLVDFDAWSSDKPATPLVEQVDAHGAVSRASTRGLIGRASARFHPFVAFDPLREVRQRTAAGSYRPYGDARVFAKGTRYQCPPPGAPVPTPQTPDPGAIELVRYAIETAGFIGCKLYPPVGFAPLDNERLNADNQRLKDDKDAGKRLDLALRAFYAYCEAEEVPITTHTSPGNEYGLGFRDLVAPARWAPVLAEFPRLRLNLGHFGQDEGIDPEVGVAACTAWIRQAASLMNVYPNVYADLSNSALVYDDVYATKYLGHVADIFRLFPNVRKRVMYGSDFWLNRLAAGADDFVRQFNTKLTTTFGPATRADIMGTNALRFLGFLDDQDKRPLTARNPARLRRFYGAQPLPPWLAAG